MGFVLVVAMLLGSAPARQGARLRLGAARRPQRGQCRWQACDPEPETTPAVGNPIANLLGGKEGSGPIGLRPADGNPIANILGGSGKEGPGPIDYDVAGPNSNDRWSGSRATTQQLRDLAEQATSTREPSPIIPQWLPAPTWLWRQWRGTIVREVLPCDVLVSTLWAVVVAAFFYCPGPHFVWRAGLTRHLIAVERVWSLASSLVSFILSFFLTQSYTFWREVYVVVRQVQGRLNDVGLLVASSVRRDDNGSYTPEADEFLRVLGRHVRLYNILLYASVTTRFAPLATPAGLTQLVQSGALLEDERSALLEASTGQNAVLLWLSAECFSALTRGQLAAGSASCKSGLSTVLLDKLTELRSTAASISDKLSGRMPLAYTQLVQILVDLFVLTSPFALIHSVGSRVPPLVGAVGAVVGTALVAFFHRSLLNLAKYLLDPFGNTELYRTKDSGISINVATILQETNLGSERWRISGQWVPRRARPPAGTEAALQAVEAEAASKVANNISVLHSSEGGADSRSKADAELETVQ
ncbi:Bestrophin, RFP-TM, chloride channel-domain-containing protein [Pavlovales sp. CCMP2436]|nr:Bestrophin, RFP-TM, chloride channel-domain-containing protein [Pavlovales sp. CCMP2436]|mmetsp:Transcript_13285/g.33776  ORF Transcript_13285/g.33776 Transcript_13285/m.33776 type:complete len:529 (-) Transcript_13285:101-1687(-)|eukprot:CAMPEP_0179964946 /NCGR_PEP_ID=MMETSP0983-20121128/31601_1 /TAXON_ID=483367 /ORGANISM="non described non described, Strain CCMP 2436" /LENGTH=528 /DNA_ID=CAMNT_0021877709 /DNA_START=27 /DNA_END=1613 /DNA_ORIENTATION=-